MAAVLSELRGESLPPAGASRPLLQTRQDFEAITAACDSFRGPLESAFRDRDQSTIWCRACGRLSRAVTTMQPRGGDWISLTEGLICEGCGLNGRMRGILRALDDVFPRPSDAASLVFERVTALYPHLERRFPRLVGCEFLPGMHQPGDMVEFQSLEIRHEDMMALSFGDASLDVVMHFDVLEHVPDWRRGLRECRRVLRPDGRLVFTLPFFHNLERNIVRAELSDGRLVHHLPPGYHGNPVDGQGALVYTHPSWELLEGLAEAGFEAPAIAFSFDPIEGILSNGCPFPDGHTWPVTFIARPAASARAA